MRANEQTYLNFKSDVDKLLDHEVPEVNAKVEAGNSKKSLMPEIKAIQDGNQSFNTSFSKKKSCSIDNIFLSG